MVNNDKHYLALLFIISSIMSPKLTGKKQDIGFKKLYNSTNNFSIDTTFRKFKEFQV